MKQVARLLQNGAVGQGQIVFGNVLIFVTRISGIKDKVVFRG